IEDQTSTTEGVPEVPAREGADHRVLGPEILGRVVETDPGGAPPEDPVRSRPPGVSVDARRAAGVAHGDRNLRRAGRLPPPVVRIHALEGEERAAQVERDCYRNRSFSGHRTLGVSRP